jgi:hypothetical protein
MTHQEMINVIAHHMNGGKIEFKNINQNNWVECCDPNWNFSNYNYRIVKTKTINDMQPGDTATMIDQYTGARIALLQDRMGVVLIENWNDLKAYETVWMIGSFFKSLKVVID